MIGPDFLLQFSRLSARSPALPGCSLVKQTCLKSASWKAAGGTLRMLAWLWSLWTTASFCSSNHVSACSSTHLKPFLQAARSKIKGSVVRITVRVVWTGWREQICCRLGSVQSDGGQCDTRAPGWTHNLWEPPWWLKLHLRTDWFYISVWQTTIITYCLS